MNKNAVAFDFDGVIHNLANGWQDGKIYGEINQDVIEAMLELNKMKIPVFIFSSRQPSQLVTWWNSQGYGIKAKEINDFFFNDTDYIGITRRKLPAQIYFDDRAVKYQGQSKKQILLAVIKGES